MKFKMFSNESRSLKKEIKPQNEDLQDVSSNDSNTSSALLTTILPAAKQREPKRMALNQVDDSAECYYTHQFTSYASEIIRG